MDPNVCLEELERAVKTRNLLKVREILMKNLSDYPDNPEFLKACVQVAEKDPLTFHPHDQEYLNSNDQRWNWSDFSYLKQRLSKNFSKERYEVAIQMAGYFEVLRIQEAEEAARLEAEKLAEELKETRAERKRLKRLEKAQAREARRIKRRNDRKLPHKQVLLGVKVSGLLLVYFVIHLILTEF